MLVATLLVEREVIPGEQARIKELLRELRSRATRQRGFISGETVVGAFSPNLIMTISAWSSIAAWESCERDLDRTEVIDRINRILQRTPVARLWLHDEDVPAGAT